MTAKTLQLNAALPKAPEAPDAILARARAELERQRMLAEEARRMALEEAEKAFQAILNASSEELRMAVMAAAEEHGGKAILSENSLLMYWSEAGNISGPAGWRCDLVPRKKAKPSPSHNGNGNGAPNFNGKRIAIRPETLATVEEQVGQPGLLKGRLIWGSMRELAVALGVSKDDQHPDTTLRRTFSAVKADLDDADYQASAITGPATVAELPKLEADNEPTSEPGPSA
mgnify:CR=1 FL=1